MPMHCFLYIVENKQHAPKHNKVTIMYNFMYIDSKPKLMPKMYCFASTAVSLWKQKSFISVNIVCLTYVSVFALRLPA